MADARNQQGLSDHGREKVLLLFHGVSIELTMCGDNMVKDQFVHYKKNGCETNDETDRIGTLASSLEGTTSP